MTHIYVSVNKATSDQIMACHLFRANPLSEPKLNARRLHESLCHTWLIDDIWVAEGCSGSEIFASVLRGELRGQPAAILNLETKR